MSLTTNVAPASNKTNKIAGQHGVLLQQQVAIMPLHSFCAATSEEYMQQQITAITYNRKPSCNHTATKCW